MIPDLQAEPVGGELVEFDAQGIIDAPLFWQQWRLRSDSLERVAAAVQSGARELLR
jgi:LysR family transcriptional regulator (chromosome initiation inhibitor)